MNQTTLIESFHQGHCIDAYELFGAHFTTAADSGMAGHMLNSTARSRMTDRNFLLISQRSPQQMK